MHNNFSGKKIFIYSEKFDEYGIPDTDCTPGKATAQNQSCAGKQP
jgi:hypothetical protein